MQCNSVLTGGCHRKPPILLFCDFPTSSPILTVYGNVVTDRRIFFNICKDFLNIYSLQDLLSIQSESWKGKHFTDKYYSSKYVLLLPVWNCFRGKRTHFVATRNVDYERFIFEHLVESHSFLFFFFSEFDIFSFLEMWNSINYLGHWSHLIIYDIYSVCEIINFSGIYSFDDFVKNLPPQIECPMKHDLIKTTSYALCFIFNMLYIMLYALH